MILPASYQSVFSPRDGQPLYPELWRGCVGAWAPLLGPTGLTLRDWSGYGNHGAMTNMDAGTDWTGLNGKYLLDFDGSNDFVSFPVMPFLTGITTITVSCFVSVSSASQLTLVSRYYQTTIDNGWLLQGGTTSGFRFAGRESVASFLSSGNSGAINAGQVYHVCGRKVGNEWSIWVDGRLASSANVGVGTTVFGVNPLFLARIDTPSPIYTACNLDDVRIYTRSISPQEIRLLATRRGIAYELAPRRRSSSAVQFNRRRRLLLGAS